MAVGILIAVYPSRADAERARSALLDIGVAPSDIGVSADVMTASAAAIDKPAAEGRGDEAGFWDRFFEQAVSDYNRNRYDSEGGDNDGQTAVAVRLEGGAGAVDRRRITDALAACNPLGFEGDTAATASEDDFIQPEPVGWVREGVTGAPMTTGRANRSGPAGEEEDA